MLQAGVQEATGSRNNLTISVRQPIKTSFVYEGAHPRFTRFFV